MMKLKWIMMLSTALLFMSCDNSETASSQSSEVETDFDGTKLADNSRNALDWAGVYEGTLPCADCDGIDTRVTLNEDETYVYEYIYLTDLDVETDFVEQGKFEWDETGSKITIFSEVSDIQVKFRVGENHIVMLDSEGYMIKGELAEHYILTKTE